MTNRIIQVLFIVAFIFSVIMVAIGIYSGYEEYTPGAIRFNGTIMTQEHEMKELLLILSYTLAFAIVPTIVISAIQYIVIGKFNPLHLFKN